MLTSQIFIQLIVILIAVQVFSTSFITGCERTPG